jgi:hypothetical protein
MPKSWNTKGTDTLTAEPTKIKLNKGDAERLGAAPLKPRKVRAARKPIGVYLSDREKRAVELRAIEAGETMSEWVRNTIRKAAKC